MSEVISKLSARVKERGLLGLFFIAVQRVRNAFYLAELKNKIGKGNIGRDCYFDRDIEVKCKTLKLGDNVYIGRNVVIWGTGSIEIGSNSIISDHVSIYADKAVTIGEHCSVASFSYIIDSNHQVRKHILIHQQTKDTIPVEIGNDVWISASCVILPGSKIEDGAVIGASSVVTGRIPPYSIAMGYPARVIKNRE